MLPSKGEEHAAAQPHPEPPVRRKLAPIGNPLLRPLPRFYCEPAIIFSGVCTGRKALMKRRKFYQMVYNHTSGRDCESALERKIGSENRASLNLVNDTICSMKADVKSSLLKIALRNGKKKESGFLAWTGFQQLASMLVPNGQIDQLNILFLDCDSMDTRKMHFPESLWSKGGRRRTSVVNDNVSVENFAMDKTEQDFEDEIEERFWLSVVKQSSGRRLRLTVSQSSVLRAILLCGPMLTASVVLQVMHTASSMQKQPLKSFAVNLFDRASFGSSIHSTSKRVSSQIEMASNHFVMVRESCTNSGTSFDCVQPLCAIPSPLQIAAVAIMFVQNVDEVVFGFILILVSAERGSDLRLHEDACCPQEITQAVSSTRYRVKWIILIPVRLPQDVSVRWEYYYGKRTHQNCALSEQSQSALSSAFDGLVQ
eukprot:753411-Hanusia_phi.AAC.5